MQEGINNVALPTDPAVEPCKYVLSLPGDELPFKQDRLFLSGSNGDQEIDRSAITVGACRDLTKPILPQREKLTYLNLSTKILNSVRQGVPGETSSQECRGR